MAIAVAVLVLGAIVLVVVGWMGLAGKLPRNHLAGIRTPYTMRSEENWRATHRHAAPILIFGGVAVVAAGLAFLPFAIAGSVSDRFGSIVALILAGIMLATAVASWLFGTRRARAELRDAGSPVRPGGGYSKG